MAKGFEFQLQGGDQLKKRLANLSAEVKEGIKQDIQASGQTIAAEARVRVPRDTGFLGNSISAKDIENGTEAIAQKEYAAYVEFGTGTEVEVPVGLEDYAMQFFVNGKGHMPAHPFMFPSYFVEKPRLLKRIKERIDKA